MSSSLLSPPSEAWEIVPELAGTAAENSEMLLQGRKVEVLPLAMSRDYEGSWRDGAAIKNTDCSWWGPHLGFPSTHIGRLTAPVTPAPEGPASSSGLFKCSHLCAHTHVLTPMHRHTHTHK